MVEIPLKKPCGRKPSEKSTPEMREMWRRLYYERKAKVEGREPKV
jgi:hypothetical protein